VEQVRVWRGAHADPVPLFGPLPGVRIGDTLAYEFGLADEFVPKPGHTRLQRVFVLLDLGVSMAVPTWRHLVRPDGSTVPGLDADRAEATTWYVDLVHVSGAADSIVLRDLYIDVLVPTDGRHQRLLDLDEFADALAADVLDAATAVDGLRRWQRFLDRHLHLARDATHGWADFPPARLSPLAALPSPLGPVVTAP
jgi:hypothetical protein